MKWIDDAAGIEGLQLDRYPPREVGVPKAVFLIRPERMSLADESARDNRYMQMDGGFDPARAAEQFDHLAQSLSRRGIRTIVFPGRQETPDAVFPNNVFATAPGRLIVGAMRHPIRRRETERADIRGFFTDVLGYRTIDLSREALTAELTGALVIDRARGIGFCGLSERCDRTGARRMAEAFGLAAVVVFELAEGEYHTNVVMSALAGRGLVLAPDGVADPAVARALAECYGDRTVLLDRAERGAFAGNCIALAPDQLWLSAHAERHLRSATRRALETLGFELVAVELSEIEKAGGSLRCMIGEIY